jgi:para-nitrobenzyl esterase
MAIVETQYGKVEGAINNGVHSFKGIPFAAPPVGERRWRAPEPPAPWSGVRAANGDWGKQAWQVVTDNPNSPLAFIFNARNAEYRDEDCLQLNVWTRGLDDDARPVLVWIHGGSFTGGTAGTPVYDGTSLVNRGDVVVVSINYRLGAFGFLRLTELTDGRIPASGNEGLLDQVRALEWVRDNISAFGGDPGNVTILGESAGGASVAAHLALGPSQGLFHRAMPISSVMNGPSTLENAQQSAEGFLQQLGLSAKDDIDKLIALDPEVLLNAAIEYGAQGGTFRPHIDGTLLPEPPLEAVKRGAADGIPVLVGTQRDEYRLFTCAQRSAKTAAGGSLVYANLDEAGLLAEVSKSPGDALGLIDAYREILKGRGFATDPVSIYAAIQTGRRMRMPTIALAEALAERGQPIYQYLFTAESPWDGGILRACHAIFIGFLFGTHAYSERSAEFFGQGEAADALSAHLQDAVISFARTGNPRTEALASWVAYDTQTRSTAIFGTPVEVASAPLDEERVLWVGNR